MTALRPGTSHIGHTHGVTTSDDQSGRLQELTEDECSALLATRQIGRLGFNAENYPLIFVVNYGLDRGVVVIRTHPGTMLHNANHANVTFEVDEIDEHNRAGWSVLIRGLAEEVTGTHHADLVARTHASSVQPWAPGDYGRWIRLIPHHITGRRIIPGELPPIFPRGAYL